MKEINNILTQLQTLGPKDRAVLATVVRVRGSSYRNPGARMLILDNGRWTGSISGGCLEGDAMRQAREVMNTGKPKLITYDTMDDESNDLRIGLGCNGVIDVLLEPITQEKNPASYLEGIASVKTEPCLLATVFESSTKHIRLGQRVLIKNGYKDADSELSSLISSDIKDAMDRKYSMTRKYDSEDGRIEVLLEVIEPPIELIIFGAGADAPPVSALAKTLGWRVKISDECIAHLAPVKFPKADEVVGCQRDFISRDVQISPYSAVVLMSHNYDYDLAVIRQILDCPAPYIGIMGPKKRTDKLFDQLRSEGVQLTSQHLHKIHTPVGLDIGADSPDEIALSIISEILASFSGRSGGFLKYHKGPIHKREGVDDQVFKQLYLTDSSSLREQTG